MQIYDSRRDSFLGNLKRTSTTITAWCWIHRETYIHIVNISRMNYLLQIFEAREMSITEGRYRTI